MENIKLTGVLHLKAFQNGILVWEHQDHNLIVASGYLALLSCISGVPGKKITKVQVGTNATAPTSTDTSISGALDIAISSFSPTSGKLTILFNFGEMAGNNKKWSEFGLICEDGTLFARKVVPAIAKIQDLSIEGVWIINI